MKKTKRLSWEGKSLNTSVWKYLIVFAFLSALVFLSPPKVTAVGLSGSDGLPLSGVNTNLKESVSTIPPIGCDKFTTQFQSKTSLNNILLFLIDGNIINTSCDFGSGKIEFFQPLKAALSTAINGVHGQLPIYSYQKKSFIKTYYYEKN